MNDEINHEATKVYASELTEHQPLRFEEVANLARGYLDAMARVNRLEGQLRGAIEGCGVAKMVLTDQRDDARRERDEARAKLAEARSLVHRLWDVATDDEAAFEFEEDDSLDNEVRAFLATAESEEDDG